MVVVVVVVVVVAREEEGVASVSGALVGKGARASFVRASAGDLTAAVVKGRRTSEIFPQPKS